MAVTGGIRARAQRFDLSGKIALVTGSSRGLGRVVVLAYTDISRGWAQPGEDVPDAPPRRFGYLGEITTAALHFGSDASSYTTGSLLRVDRLRQV